MKYIFSLIMMLIIVSGCTSFAPETRLTPPVEVPESYSIPIDGRGTKDKWWEHFGSEELNVLIRDSLKNNFSMLESWARLNQARSVAVQSGASLQPSLDLDSSYRHDKSYLQKSKDAPFVRTDKDTYKVGLAASYELDLWGKLRSKSEASLFAVQATREEVETVAMSLAATIADTWISLLAVRDELRLLQKQIDTSETLVSLLELRFAKSMATALDVVQQREVLARTRAEQPLLKARESILLNSLAVLTGKAPGKGSVVVKQTKLPTLISLPAVGLPSSLLSDRPDIRAAVARLHSADWGVSFARADRLPSISLNVNAAFQSGGLDYLFTNWLTSLTAGITGPIFDGGYRKAEVDRVRAVAEERVAQYGNTVLSALREVENAMVNDVRQEEYLSMLAEEKKINKVALSESRLRYLMGQAEFLPFLLELLNSQKIERNLIVQRANHIKFRIALYRSLGGSWTDQLSASESE